MFSSSRVLLFYVPFTHFIKLIHLSTLKQSIFNPNSTFLVKAQGATNSAFYCTFFNKEWTIFHTAEHALFVLVPSTMIQTQQSRLKQALLKSVVKRQNERKEGTQPSWPFFFCIYLLMLCVCVCGAY